MAAYFFTFCYLLSFSLIFLSVDFTLAAPTDRVVTAKSTGTMKYHNGPVLSSNISVYLIWYGTWPASHKQIIRDFIESFNAPNIRSPSVADWWRVITMYTDQTGANVSRSVALGAETDDKGSQGRTLTPLLIQYIIASAIRTKTNPIPANPRGGVYLVLTAEDIYVQTFCQICGFHLFTFPAIVGFTLPFIWVGNSAKLCPVACEWPYVVPHYMPKDVKPLKSPNGVPAVDAMVDVIGKKLANLATNPLENGWYADEASAQGEVGYLCQGVYGVGGGTSDVGKVLHHDNGAVYNMYGARRTFLVQWIWSNVANKCVGNM